MDESVLKERSQRQVPESYNYTEYHPMEEVKMNLSLFAFFVAILYLPQEATPCLQKAILELLLAFGVFFEGSFLTV